jgi:uncharacterized protein
MSMSKPSTALDRRRIDTDGHLFVDKNRISAARVNQYYGREVADWQRLGLQANKLYRLYRNPDELKRAASTFQGKPLLIDHEIVNASEPAQDRVAGAVNNVRFNAPYLLADLAVWRADAIELIKSGMQRQLSCGYRYDADMRAGVTPEGEAYDGVMRNIVGNHVALVRQGRAGPDVQVADSAPFVFDIARIFPGAANIRNGGK